MMTEAALVARCKPFTLRAIEVAAANYQGWCLSCRLKHDNIEPDARGYVCERCETSTVYGAEECAIMGLVR